MKKFRHPHVVVGVDDSLAGYAALRAAVRFARTNRMPLHAIRAEPALGVQENYAPGVFTEALGGVPRDIYVEMESVPSSAHKALLESATDPRDVIVVGGDGKGALRALWSGSVSRRLLKKARCQIIVVPPPEMRRATRRSLRKLHASRADVWDRFESEIPQVRGRPFQDS
jgi:nucleotide-binding universal stress UspA family protein